MIKMSAKFTILLVVFLCTTARTLSIQIKHTYNGERQLVELEPNIYAISKMGTNSNTRYKALSRNEDRIAAYIDHCVWISSRYSELHEDELKYLNTHYESLAHPSPTTFTIPETGSVTYVDSENITISALHGEQSAVAIEHKGFSFRALLGTLTVSKLEGEMEMGLIRLFFIEDLFVLVYANNWVDMIPCECSNEAERVYFEELQETLASRGVHFNSNNCLYYDPARDQPESSTKVPIEQDGREVEYKEELQQLEAEMSLEMDGLKSDIDYELEKIELDSSLDLSSAKEQMQERFRKTRDEIHDKYDRLRKELKRKYNQV